MELLQTLIDRILRVIHTEGEKKNTHTCNTAGSWDTIPDIFQNWYCDRKTTAGKILNAQYALIMCLRNKDLSVHTCVWMRESRREKRRREGEIERKSRGRALRHATTREPEDVQQLSCQPHKQPRCQIYSNKEALNMWIPLIPFRGSSHTRTIKHP